MSLIASLAESQPNSTDLDPEQLAQRWQVLREAFPKLRIRDAAAHLDVTEAQLVALGCGDSTMRLTAEFGSLLPELPRLGRILALTRNEHAVHEKHGQYDNVSIDGPMGLVLDPDIDLRLFLRAWRHGFAVTEKTDSGLRHSLQFFDQHGDAVHKVFLLENSDVSVFHELQQRFAGADQSPSQTVVARTPETPARPADDSPGPVDWAGFFQAWRDMRDTHEFFPLLQRFKVSRTRALSMAPADLAQRVYTSSLRSVLETAAANGIPIMVFVGNAGCIQIHTGPVQRVKAMEGWLNVLDPGFNLHVKDSGIANCWIVRKPTEDGFVNALEVYDADDNQVLQVFGKRKPGIPEMRSWRQLLSQLPEVGPELGDVILEEAA